MTPFLQGRGGEGAGRQGGEVGAREEAGVRVEEAGAFAALEAEGGEGGGRDAGGGRGEALGEKDGEFEETEAEVCGGGGGREGVVGAEDGEEGCGGC